MSIHTGAASHTQLQKLLRAVSQTRQLHVQPAAADLVAVPWLQITALKASKTADAIKAKQDEEQLQRLDTASRLEMAAEREQSWVRRTAIKVSQDVFCCCVSVINTHEDVEVQAMYGKPSSV